MNRILNAWRQAFGGEATPAESRDRVPSDREEFVDHGPASPGQSEPPTHDVVVHQDSAPETKEKSPLEKAATAADGVSLFEPRQWVKESLDVAEYLGGKGFIPDQTARAAYALHDSVADAVPLRSGQAGRIARNLNEAGALLTGIDGAVKANDRGVDTYTALTDGAMTAAIDLKAHPLDVAINVVNDVTEEISPARPKRTSAAPKL
jgi:hypothetical protein